MLIVVSERKNRANPAINQALSRLIFLNRGYKIAAKSAYLNTMMGNEMAISFFRKMSHQDSVRIIRFRVKK